MNCCACNGTCNHTGPHSYCSAHGGSYWPVTTAPVNHPCPNCGYCPCCGRRSAAPWNPWPSYPYGPIVATTHPYYNPTTTCVITSTVTGGILT